MSLGEGMARLDGYRFEVRYSNAARERAVAAAELAAAAFGYFSGQFAGVEPEIALIVAGEDDWSSAQPYGLPYFSDDPGQLRPGIIVMSAGPGSFWTGMVSDIGDLSPQDHARLQSTYPDGAGGVDLQPFFDLITIHELGHAFEVLGDLRMPTSWLSEIFVNLALHAFVARHSPELLPTLETLPTLGAESRGLASRMREEGYTTLKQLEAHYPGGEDPMGPLNYVWFQYRWQRLAADVFTADGEAGLIRFWECFHGRDRREARDATAAALAPLLSREVSPTLGRAIRNWR